MKKKILYYGSCWPTNIGNAFVNFGAINSIKRALGDNIEIYHFGGMSSYLFRIHGYPQNNLDINVFADFDYVVLGGMTQCVDNFEAAEVLLRSFVQRGIKIIISGGGAGHYTQEEVRVVREWMREIPIFCFISRDRYSYENYHDLADGSFDGIDSAFFVPDNFKPIPFGRQEFNVLNFDSYDEPAIVNSTNGTDSAETQTDIQKTVERRYLRGFRRYLKQFIGIPTPPLEKPCVPAVLDMGGRAVIRTHHAAWPSQTTEKQFIRKNTLISDLPSDYLTLYSQAHTVYSDRIHACIATLAFGNRAMLFGREVPRLRMFERVGAREIMNKPVQLDMENLSELKRQQVEFLRKTLI